MKVLNKNTGMSIISSEPVYILYLNFCLLLLFSPCSAGDPCPFETVLAPCTCSQTTAPSEILSANKPTPAPRPKRDVIGNMVTTDSQLYTTVECLKPESLSALQEVISTALDRKCVDKLIVANIPQENDYTLARLPTDWLANIRVRHLQILNSHLSGDFLWKGNPLKNQTESLYWLTVNNCYLPGLLTHSSAGTVHFRGLNTLRRLKGIDFSTNHLTAISSSAFSSPQANLTTLIFAKNNIEHIDYGTFQYIRFLKHIDLSHNLLTTVLRTYFSQQPKFLEYIDLSWNSLTFLPINFFDNMTALKTVNISHNFLYSLPIKPWYVAWTKLRYIDLSGNFLVCDCNLTWLPPILLPPNGPSTVPKPLPGQTVIGRCAETVLRAQLLTTDHDLTALTREKLNCQRE